MRETSAATGMPALPLGVILALCAAAVASGCDVRSALVATARAIGGQEGDVLVAVVAGLDQGLSWEQAWFPAGRLAPLGRALHGPWHRGASPQATLDAARLAANRRTQVTAERAAARAAARLTMPLTLCLLPAFVLVGIVPLVVVLAAGVVPVLGG